MKSLIAVLPIFLSLTFSQNSFSQKHGISSLLEEYYGIKEALVESNASSASTAASTFGRQLQKLVAAGNGQQRSLAEVAEDLSRFSSAISFGKDVSTQRLHFASLSAVMIRLMKSVSVDRPAFVIYCPMKKVSWISAEAAIRNPFYGNAMLNCGKVTERLK